MKKLLVTLAAVLLFCTTVCAESLNLNQIMESTCRVRVSSIGTYGTGTTVAERNGKYFIFTNAHVVSSSNTVTVEFFTQGAKTLPIKGDVVWRAYKKGTDVDFALITIPTSSFFEWKPRIIPLAPRNFNIIKNSYIQSAGCPEARWPMAWEGRVTVDRGSRLLFTPPPTEGQSGSGLLVNVPDSTGELFTRVGGIITWRIGKSGRATNGYDYATGGAIPITRLYDALEGRDSTPLKIPEDYNTISSTIKTDSPLKEQALGTDGKYYNVMVNGTDIEAINLPLGVSILRWPDREVRQPANPLVPALITRGGSYGAYQGYGYSDGYGISGRQRYSDGYRGNYGGRDELEGLKNRVDGLGDDLLLLDKEKSLLETQKSLLEKTLDGRNQELNALKYSSETNRELILKLSADIEKREAVVDALMLKLKTTGDELHLANIDIENLTTSVGDVSWQRNTVGGVSLLGILLVVGGFLWRFLGREKIKGVIDAVEDRVQDRVEDVIGEDKAQDLRDLIDGLEKKLGDRIDSKFDHEFFKHDPAKGGLISPD